MAPSEPDLYAPPATQHAVRVRAPTRSSAGAEEPLWMQNVLGAGAAVRSRHAAAATLTALPSALNWLSVNDTDTQRVCVQKGGSSVRALRTAEWLRVPTSGAVGDAVALSRASTPLQCTQSASQQ